MIDPSPTALSALVADIAGSGFHVDAEAARAALVDRSQFNAIGPGRSASLTPGA